MNKNYLFHTFITLLFIFFGLTATPLSAQRRVSQAPNNERLAYELYNKQEYQQAFDLYRQLFENSRNTNVYYLNMATDCALKLKNYDVAEHLVRDFLKNYPDETKQLVDLGYIYSLKGNSEKAQRHFERLIKKHAATKSQILELGSAFLSRGLHEQAVLTYEKGQKDKTIDYDFLLEKANAYYAMLETEKAVDCFLDYLEKNPNDYEVVKARIRTLMLYDINGSLNAKIRRSILRKAKEHLNNTMFNELVVWFALQTQDYQLALEYELALDRRKIDENRESNIIYLADIALDNRVYDVAIEAYSYVRNKRKDGVFYNDASVKLISARYAKMKEENVDDQQENAVLLSDCRQVLSRIGFSEQSMSVVIVEADILAYSLSQSSEALALLDSALVASSSARRQAELKLKKADIHLLREEVWDATLLYSQVEKRLGDAPMAHEARFRNAQLRYFIGEFNWAVNALDILKGSTSKLIANDAMSLSILISDNQNIDTAALSLFAKADYASYRRQDEKAKIFLDEIIDEHSNATSTPYALIRLAKIAQKNKEFNAVDSLCTIIYSDFPESFVADQALMLDAKILAEELENKEKALKCYEKILDEYNVSLYLAEARKNYRLLK